MSQQKLDCGTDSSTGTGDNLEPYENWEEEPGLTRRDEVQKLYENATVSPPKHANPDRQIHHHPTKRSSWFGPDNSGCMPLQSHSSSSLTLTSEVDDEVGGPFTSWGRSSMRDHRNMLAAPFPRNKRAEEAKPSQELGLALRRNKAVGSAATRMPHMYRHVLGASSIDLLRAEEGIVITNSQRRLLGAGEKTKPRPTMERMLSIPRININSVADTIMNNTALSSAPNAEEGAGAFVLPHWSVEDKSERKTLTPSFVTQMLRTNIPITAVYLTCLAVILSYPNNAHLQAISIGLVLAFIGLQTIVTIAQAVPDNASDTEELDQRTTAIIFLSMVLYPCIGLWVIEHDDPWELSGLYNLWFANIHQYGHYSWGYVFPFFLWGLSALMFMRGAYSAFGRDTSGVISGEDGKPETQLYRTIPGKWEICMARFCRRATMTSWHLLSEDIKPASKGGRFLFQMVGHVPLIFLYIGFRFCAYSWEQLQHAMQQGPYQEFLSLTSSQGDEAVLSARLIVWSAFFLHTVVLRAILPSHLFLHFSIGDKQSLLYRSVSWQKFVAPTKRTRLLWGFRGFILALVPYVIHSNEIHPSERVRCLLWFLYILQLVSYFMEGLMAMCWALNEGARSCHMNHPFEAAVAIFFWASYNAFLQPGGTLINVAFYFINQERARGVILTEIWGPLVHRGHFRQWVTKLCALLNPLRLVSYTCWNWKADQKPPPDEKEVDLRLEEWINTWRRKRVEVGKTADNFTVVRRPKTFKGKNKLDDEPLRVFYGSVFPSYEEYLYMRDNPANHVHLDIWNDQHPEEKFLDWYPTYAEEVIELLNEPYDFHVKREVWMFGYGSLLSPDTPPAGLTPRQRKMLLPYWLKKSSGYKNSFSFRHGSCAINALGLLPAEEDEDGEHVCGCVYPIDYEVACDLFCYREDGYEFLLVAVEHFQEMHPSYKVPEGVGYIWMCGAPTQTCSDRLSSECDDWYCKRHVPTKDSPILQSYVDSIMAGALRYETSGAGQEDGMRFCAAIMSTIQDWDFPWYNDRILAGRPWVWRKEWQIIDGLLNTCPNTSIAFSQRMNPMIECPSASRQSMTIRDELRYEGWTSQFFAAWTDTEDERKKLSSLSAHERFERLRKRRSMRLTSRRRPISDSEEDSETQDTSNSMHREELFNRHSSVTFAAF